MRNLCIGYYCIFQSEENPNDFNCYILKKEEDCFSAVIKWIFVQPDGSIQYKRQTGDFITYENVNGMLKNANFFINKTPFLSLV